MVALPPCTAHGKESMQATSDLHIQIASALTGVVKQIKAIRYYPPKHPALQAAAEECLRGFRPLLASGSHFALVVRKEGFLFDDSPVAKGNQVLVQLANFCFARRIQYLTFLADLNSRDLNHFVHYLILDPQTIQKNGGIQAILEKARVITIWANIHDLDSILERREELEQRPEPESDPTAILAEGDESAQSQGESISLEELLSLMEKEKDDGRFRHHLQELIPLLRLQLSEDNRPLVLRAFLLLCRGATGKQVSATRMEQSQHALGQLTNNEMTDYLVAYALAEDLEQKTFDILSRVLAFLGDKTSRRLMELLAEEGTASKRKTLSSILVRSNNTALPILFEYLLDDRWYVVRNSSCILGEIRNQEALVHLTPLLEHKDLRVRRETIRALTKIGGQRAINILLQAAETGDQELRRQALLSLGAIRAASAVPTLIKLLKQSDWSQRAIELKKDAIRALGEIRTPDAIPELTRIATHKRLLRRKLNEELRLAATMALGDIADESTRDILTKITHDRNAAIARAAAQGLKQLDKANP